MSAVTGARAMGFVTASTKTNLDKPELTIAIKYGEGKDERVTFARSGADGFAERARQPRRRYGRSVHDRRYHQGTR